ncbi:MULTISPECIES: DUF536 domain-containing protein [Lactobacillales]|uniref:DUF536 domain-containing protein n=1 Tax=Lactobacillales TaxID=186826 RepID=UPI00065FEBEF|nr:DUF536 domain-containing protein [Carnobacterium sp. 1290_CSPC]
MGNVKNDKVQVQLRLTANEREKIKKNAEKNNQSMNRYILEKILVDDNKDASVENTNSYTNYRNMLSFFESQIRVKDEQIKSLSQRLESAHRLIDQQQQLQLSTNKHIESLESEKKANQQSEHSNRKWWAIFLKK